MTPVDRIARVRALLEKARDLRGDEREAFLTRECGDDDDLRREVDELLVGLEAAGTITLGVEGAGAVGTDARDALIAQLSRHRSLESRYEDHGEFARGGMGQLRLIFDTDVRRQLAMKVLLDRDDVDPADFARSLGYFMEEAQVTGQLDHPGIVPVHELGVDADGRVFFTMKLVKGEDLRNVFDRVADPADGDWNPTRALNVMLRVCEAMAYAHDKGVIHRDLKPGNVMVGKYGEAYVMDWGLAKVLGREDSRDLRLQADATASLKTERKDAAAADPDSPILTMDGAVVGTPAYMPPEQAKGRVEEIGPPADVYAVGAMLYHLLSGRMPYTEPGDRISARMILFAVTQGPPSSLADLAPDAPAELVAIVEQAMARELGDRYPDMTALARDLRAFLENRVVAAYETGAWAELKKWVARNRALAATAAVALVAVVALAGWALAERKTARENEKVAIANEQEADSQRDRADENATKANQRAEEAEEARIQAEAERDRVLRLSDKRRLDVLLQDADALWPAHPEKIGPLKAWLARANDLLGNLPLHEATMADVRATGTPRPDPRDGELATLREHLAQHEVGEEVGWEAFDDEVEGEEDDDEAGLVEHVSELSAAIAALDVTIERERGYDFGEDADARWWHDAVKDLVVGLHALTGDDVHRATVAGVGSRLSWAETVTEKTTTGTDAAAQWAATREAVRDHPKYDGLDLKPQIGLVPLGPDPDSTLWEFGHPRTGDIPVRHPETGKLAIGEESGMVFVLIPGGTYRLGAQKEDEDAPHYDPQAAPEESPLRDVTLSPYFLSKYEMTQGQWARFTGENPSHFDTNYKPRGGKPVTLKHPVEQVSWEMCRDTLSRLGLVLPTEAQWEAACRAGTETPWWTGMERNSLEGAANLADQAGKRSGATWPHIEDWPELEDGYAVHAPVGSYRANAFGLHDTCGNVWEWCRDGFSSSAYERVTTNEGDGFRDVRGASSRVLRGGSFDYRASLARSANRDRDTPEARNGTMGVRPARFCN